MTKFDELLKDAKPLRELVKQYGAKRVWTVGMDVLEFPPAWMPSHNDALKIQAELEKGKL